MCQQVKVCPKCGKEKSLEEFSRSKARAHLDGRSGYCKLCSRASAKKFREENPQRNAEYLRQYRKDNPEKFREYDRRRKLTPAERTAIFREANPGYFLMKSHEWRARRRETAVEAVPADKLLARLAYYGGRCWICGAPWEQWDHVKPLSRGGWHILANLRPACARCNKSKNAKWPFRTTGRYRP